MGRTIENKKEIVADLESLLADTQLTLVVNYQGLSVSEITQLRTKMYEVGSICKITKNTLMGIAVKENSAWQPMSEFLKGTNAFILVKDNLPGAIKAYEEFQKASKKTELRGGVMEGRALSLADISALKDLPTKEELIARIAGGINAIPTKLAVGLNAVPTKLAVGVKEVPGKLVRAIKAVSEKDQAA
ncbi:MAG: 50S ribosomal protein L10 [Prochlorotrichaceae cyanobacterium]